MLMHAIVYRVYRHQKKVCTESFLWEENPLPHQGIELVSAAWWSYALPTEPHPHPPFLRMLEAISHRFNYDDETFFLNCHFPEFCADFVGWTEFFVCSGERGGCGGTERSAGGQHEELDTCRHLWPWSSKWLFLLPQSVRCVWCPAQGRQGVHVGVYMYFVFFVFFLLFIIRLHACIHIFIQ